MKFDGYPKNAAGLYVIPRADYLKEHPDYRGTWSRPDRPDLVGKKTVMGYDAGGTFLAVEGEFFVFND